MSTKKEKVKFKKKILKCFFLVFVGVFLICLFLSSRKIWDGRSKISLAINRTNGDVLVSTFDPEANEIVNILIPGETQVEVARQLGVWRLKSVWQLSKNEDLEGKLLFETLIKHFSFPLSAWADDPASGFSEGGFLALVEAVFVPYKTTLSLADKLAICLFSLGVASSNRSEIDLSEVGYLEARQLNDGKEGYVIGSSLSPKILATFADSDMSKGKTSVVIRDASGGTVGIGRVGKVIEILGAKVVSVLREEGRKMHCLVVGEPGKGADKIARIFSCNLEEKKLEGKHDVEILIGSDFAKRF